jgi:hypothetical protein
MAAATAELRALVSDGSGHVVTAPPGDLPQWWQSLPTPPNCSQPQAPPAPHPGRDRGGAARAGRRPDRDRGMHHRERGTIPHLLASHKRAEVAPR